MRDNLLSKIEVVTTPVIGDDGQNLTDMKMYSIEIVIGGRRFFDAWRMGNDEQIEAELATVISGIEAGVEVKTR